MSQTKAELIKGLNINASAPATALQIDASGNVNIDSNTLYVDATNNRVGIGTTSPSADLVISKSNGRLDLNNPANPRVSGDIGRLTFSVDSAQNVAATVGATNVGAISGATAIYFNTWNGTSSGERARIDPEGRLLVGTSSTPVNTTAVFAGNSAGATGNADVHFSRGLAATGMSSGQDIGILRFSDNAGNSFATIGAQVDATPGSSDYPGRLVFSTTADGASSPTERLYITSGGIVTTDTAFGSVLSGTADGVAIQTTNDALVASRSSNACLQLRRRTTDGDIALFFRDTTQVGRISVTTTATAYNTSSDYRLKENIYPVTDGITRLQQLKPSRFNFIADPDTTVDGFIAHEVQSVVPEAITGEKDAVDDDDNPVYQGIDQSKLVPLLTAALQEAISEIESLKARLTAAGI